ncbi:MAG: zinc-dependent peptidase [Cyclobacteriaceae bacterium]
MQAFFTVVGFGLFAFLGYWAWSQNRPVYQVPKKFSAKWRELLQTHVHFYQNLDASGKRNYEKKISNFLRQVRITGIRTEVTDLDRLLTASSAVIPLFNFPSWKYTYLHEVLLYPAAFDHNFSMENPEQVITGMVGNGRNMEGVMILSKQSLRQGFTNTTDKHNVGIHEFVHILDKQDGEIDGIPGELNDKQYAKPWLQLMHREMKRIRQGKSDIDEYAGTKEEEFLAVTSEYFFERPKLLQQKHPELYKLLRKVYHQDMVKRLRKPFRKPRRIGRNDPCPCGSGEKFKQCCMNN